MSTNVALLGSTGSIGTQTLDVLRSLPETFRLVGLAGGLQSDLIDQQVAEFQPTRVVRGDTRTGKRPGAEELVDIATLPDVDIVVVGTIDLVAFEETRVMLSAWDTGCL